MTSQVPGLLAVAMVTYFYVHKLVCVVMGLHGAGQKQQKSLEYVRALIKPIRCDG